MLELSGAEARRMAVASQMLSAPRPRTMHAVIERLGGLQIDPTNTVARTEHMVLFSRLGRYKVADLERELWERKTLFEYWARIVPLTDFAIHREVMHRVLDGALARTTYTRGWLKANASFRKYLLARLADDGPLRTDQIEDRAAVGWRTGGWNENKNVSRMLEVLHASGAIVIAGREGGARLWDLAERLLPVNERRLDAATVARRIVERQLRARGLARTTQFGSAFDGRVPGFEGALQDLVDEGVAVPAKVAGTPGRWFAHTDALGESFKPRTTFLSPFDPLVSNRNRAEELFGFRFRLEIYVPKDKREYGYYVLPILHGDRLVGRADAAYDRRTSTLRLKALYAEPDAPASAGPAIAKTARELATWLGAERVEVGKAPRAWRGAMSLATGDDRTR
jgi:uncharacterized protein